MPSIYDLKPKFQNLLRPILRAMHSLGISPNAITLMALALSFATGVAIYCSQKPDYRWLLLAPPAALFVRMALNALDGMMAREYKLFSNEGKILNEFGDVIADTAIYLPLWFTVNETLFAQDPQWLAWQLKATRWAIVGFVLLAILSEFAGVLAVDLCGKRLYQGPGGKSDRAFLIGLYLLVLYFWHDLPQYALYYFAFLDLLVVLSIRNRLVAALKLAREQAASPAPSASPTPHSPTALSAPTADRSSTGD